MSDTPLLLTPTEMIAHLDRYVRRQARAAETKNEAFRALPPGTP